VLPQPSISLPVAAGIVALALAEGGFSASVLGVATVATWLLIGGLLLGGSLGLGAVTRRLTVLIGLLAALAVWTALSLSWTADDGAGFIDLVRILLYTGLVLLVGLGARAGSAPSWLAGIALGGTVVATIALGSRLLGLGGDQDLALELNLAAERLSYPIGYWNGLGYLLAMTLPAVAWLTVAARTSIARAALAGSVPLVTALFLTSSRGAMLAGAIGLLIVLGFAVDRHRVTEAAIVAVPAWAVVIIAAAVARGELSPIGGPSAAGLAIAALVAAIAAGAHLTFGRLDARAAAQPASRPSRQAGGRVVVAALAAVLAVILVLGPSALLGEFRYEETAVQGESVGFASDSGRSSFWDAALGSFGEAPLRGVGAGGYEAYWSMNGDLAVPARNAHSAPLETLAELGLPGGLSLLAAIGLGAFGAVVTLRRQRGRTRGAAAAVVGIFLAGLLAIGIDWSWELPAVVAPFLVSLTLICGSGLRPAGAPGGSLLVDSRMAGYEPLDAPSRPAPWAIGLGIGGGLLVAVWAGGVLALAAIQLDRSADRLASGDLTGAAEAARSAAQIEPWSSEPALRLAEIEQTAANLEAAELRAKEAIRLAPEDFRSWLLMSQIQVDLGRVAAAGTYGLRAQALAPLQLGRQDALPEP
jgi:hypothetical protein